MRIPSRLQSVWVGMGLAVALAAGAPAADESAALERSAAAAPRASSAAPPLAGGWIAIIDEEGLVEADATAIADFASDPQLEAAYSTSSDGLVEEPLADGEFRVHLEGRFRSLVVARVEPSGRVRVEHGSPSLDAIFDPAIRSCAQPSGVDHARR